MNNRLITIILTTLLCTSLSAEDGHRLWLGYTPADRATVHAPASSPTIDIAVDELHKYFQGSEVTLQKDLALKKTLGNEGFTIQMPSSGPVVQAASDMGLLYGAYELLRRQAIGSQQQTAITQVPAFPLRLLNHWDNLDGSIERGSAG